MADSALPNRPTPPTPVSVEDIEIMLFDPGPGNEDQTQMARYQAQVRLSDGSIELQRGNLLPHLTNAEINGLKALLLRLRGKANTAWIE
jgi:hypothetical protein